jgi:hypothetical protein
MRWYLLLLASLPLLTWLLWRTARERSALPTATPIVPADYARWALVMLVAAGIVYCAYRALSSSA